MPGDSIRSVGPGRRFMMNIADRKIAAVLFLLMTYCFLLVFVMVYCCLAFYPVTLETEIHCPLPGC